MAVDVSFPQLEAHTAVWTTLGASNNVELLPADTDPGDPRLPRGCMLAARPRLSSGSPQVVDAGGVALVRQSLAWGPAKLLLRQKRRVNRQHEQQHKRVRNDEAGEGALPPFLSRPLLPPTESSRWLTPGRQPRSIDSGWVYVRYSGEPQNLPLPIQFGELKGAKHSVLVHKL